MHLKSVSPRKSNLKTNLEVYAPKSRLISPEKARVVTDLALVLPTITDHTENDEQSNWQIDNHILCIRDSVDDYLEFCDERGEDPEKPFSGKFLLRLDKELHRKIYLRAKLEDKSINSWVSDALSSIVTEETEHAIP